MDQIRKKSLIDIDTQDTSHVHQKNQYGTFITLLNEIDLCTLKV